MSDPAIDSVAKLVSRRRPSLTPDTGALATRTRRLLSARSPFAQRHLQDSPPTVPKTGAICYFDLQATSAWCFSAPDNGEALVTSTQTSFATL